MKRFQKALLGVVVSGALLFSAQAAELPSAAKDTLQSAMTKVQQEVKDYGQVENARLYRRKLRDYPLEPQRETVFG